MMYWSPEGEITLKGAAAELFREALGAVAELLCEFPDEDSFEFGVTAFDGLQRGQKLHLLAALGRALLREDEPMPHLTAALEGALAAVFSHVREGLELELRRERPAETRFSWRRLVHAAGVEAGLEDLPAADSDLGDEWEWVVDTLEAGLFWDRDWEEGDAFLDAAPEEAARERQAYGIADDYFTDVPPDPEGDELQRVLSDLRELTGSPLRAADLWDGPTGLHDLHHDLRVGPCSDTEAETEADCPLVEWIGVEKDFEFDCTLEEWRELFRADVREAAETGPAETPEPSPEAVDDFLRGSTAGELGGDAAVRPWNSGWAVFGMGESVLVPGEDVWVPIEFIDRHPAALFGSPAAAAAAYLRYCARTDARRRIHDAAIGRLERRRGS